MPVAYLSNHLHAVQGVFRKRPAAAADFGKGLLPCAPRILILNGLLKRLQHVGVERPPLGICDLADAAIDVIWDVADV
jgi:hypothetical protein